MKRTLYIIAVSLLALGSSSCSKLLDIPQKGVVSQESFYKTDEDCMEALTAVYSAFSNQVFRNGFYLVGMMDDDTWAAGDNRGANVALESLNEFRYTSSLGSIKDAFSYDYNIIYASNLIINRVSEPDTDIKKRAVAEAYFFRAYAYFDLVTLFGAVPKVVELSDDGNYQVGNSSVEEIYELIESDLKVSLSMDVLPEKTGIDDRETGIRVTRQTAQALLGKAYLFEKKYDESAKMLDEVISSGKYGLFQGEYGDIFVAENNFNREIMLAVNYANDPVTNNFNAFGVFRSWRVDRLEGWSTAPIDVYEMGWGFGVPTKSLYDAFVEMEGVDGYRLKGTIITYDDIVSQGLKITDGKFLYGCEGYMSWKFRNSPRSHVEGTWAGFYDNAVVMRYAEVLLLASEAHLMNGDSESALRYLDEVRTRARLSPLSHSITLDDIKKEKRLELCGENLRFKDLVRWGDAYEALKNQGSYYPVFYGYKDGTTEYNVVNTASSSTDYGFKSGKHELLPIPQVEIEVNRAIKQNPGW